MLSLNHWMLLVGLTLRILLSPLSEQYIVLPDKDRELSIIEARTITVSVVTHPPPSWLVVSIYWVFTSGPAIGLAISVLDRPVDGLQLYTRPGLEIEPIRTGCLLHES